MAEKQKRCFTDIRDGIEALYRIIENAGKSLRRRNYQHWQS
ncbi:hypothetical protein ACLB1E_16865 [Escherichia coli]